MISLTPAMTIDLGSVRTAEHAALARALRSGRKCNCRIFLSIEEGGVMVIGIACGV